MEAPHPRSDGHDRSGGGACELYKMLTAAQPDEEGNNDIPWNFTKFLVDKDGNVTARFAPQVTPEEIGEQLSNWI